MLHFISPYRTSTGLECNTLLDNHAINRNCIFHQFGHRLERTSSPQKSVATCSSPLVYGVMSTQIRHACYDVLADFTSLVSKTPRPPTRTITGDATAGQQEDRSQYIGMYVMVDVEVNQSRPFSRFAVVPPSNYSSL